MEVESSSSFKLRALIRQLRPLFLEVLRTPDFRSCKAAHEIRKDMEVLRNLHKRMVLETSQLAGKVAPENRSSKTGFRPTTEGQERKRQKLAQLREFAQRATESGSSAKTPVKEATGRCCVNGSYIVGGSVSGRNFITFLGSKPVYYGVKKESFLSSTRK